MADNHLVIGTFDSEIKADDAVNALKAWDKTSEEVKLGAIGVLVADESGQLKEHKLGARSGKKGAGIGLVLAVIAPPTLLAGIVGGGILGHFHHKGLGLSPEDRERIGAELSGGKAAVGVLTPTSDQAGAISSKLAELGAVVETHDVSDEALAAVAEAAPADASEGNAADEPEATAEPA